MLYNMKVEPVIRVGQNPIVIGEGSPHTFRPGNSQLITNKLKGKLCYGIPWIWKSSFSLPKRIFGESIKSIAIEEHL
jgi:hypothetical protein